jgi:hypothetical protein
MSQLCNSRLPHFRRSTILTMVYIIGQSFAAHGQIVINEVVKEERTAGSGAVTPDTREFIELYNAGIETIDLANWSLSVVDLITGSTIVTDTIPSGMIGPGEYFVIGGAAVPGVDYSPVATDLYSDQTADMIELKNRDGIVEDAVAYEVFRADLTAITQDQRDEIGRGFQGQLLSMNANTPNERISWSRYRDGVDTNRNGLDFGMLPLTPGASNNILPQNESHTVPNADGMTAGTGLPSQYYASFVLPRVVDPTVATAINPRPIPESPQRGNAIVAWDETGGGNVVYSKELVNSFDLYAYFDTTPLGISADTNAEEWETSAYGIGSADPFFGNPDPTGGIYVSGTVTQNGSTGLGWVYQQYEIPDDPETPEVNEYDELSFSRLVLVDFGMGGNSTAEAGEWSVIETIDMSEVDSDWYRLGIDYDPATGEVLAVFDDMTFNFTTGMDQNGTFFVGYREAITAQGDRFDKLNPPIYDLYVEVAGPSGDLNGDGVVNMVDYDVLKANFGQMGSNIDGDANNDGVVNLADYTIWRDNLGATTAASLAANSSIPEPSTMSLVLVGFIGASLVARRRKL